jgi:GNAT superfamily N-acetyltransferase
MTGLSSEIRAGDMAASSPALRPGTIDDLEGCNAVIEAAVSTWPLPERVKRLSLPIYRYDAHDLEHLALLVAEEPGRGIVGVAAWEPAHPEDVPQGKKGLLLHGIYVVPDGQRSGIGTSLIAAAADAALVAGFDGVLVKAHPSAEGFFEARGLEPLPVLDAHRDYAHRFWLPLQ